MLTQSNRQETGITRLPQETINGFADRLRGPVLRPGDAGYDETRSIWNGMIDKRPALIARCTGRADVMEAVNFARSHNLLVSVRGGGHNVAGNAVCEGGLMIDLSLMKGIHVDPRTRTARAEPGVNWGELDRETQCFGLATPGGIVSLTGISGFTLGGGFGWLTRKHGFTSDNLLSADIVTADGQLLTASEEENAELFWGLRGGGGNFGVVTSFQYQLHPVGPEVMAGMVLYPLEQASEVLRFYRDYAAQAPDELGSLAVLRLAPPAPFLPESMHGKPVVGIIVCYAGPVEEGARVVQPIREFGEPLADLIAPKPYTAHQAMLDQGQLPGRQYYWKSEYLSGLSDDLIETSIAYAASITSPLTGVLLFHLQGAASRISEDEMAASHRDAAFVLNINAAWEDPNEPDRHMQWARDFWTAIVPFATGGVYVNFLSADDGADRTRAAYDPDKWKRLTALKQQYDPTNFFSLNQNIPPAE